MSQVEPVHCVPTDHVLTSSWSERLCLGEPVLTPESEPPELVESLSGRLQGTEADLRMLTGAPQLVWAGGRVC